MPSELEDLRKQLRAAQQLGKKSNDSAKKPNDVNKKQNGSAKKPNNVNKKQNDSARKNDSATNGGPERQRCPTSSTHAILTFASV